MRRSLRMLTLEYFGAPYRVAIALLMPCIAHIPATASASEESRSSDGMVWTRLEAADSWVSFGKFVALAGERALVSEPESELSGPASGAVFSFSFPSGQSELAKPEKLQQDTPRSGECFGNGLAASGSNLVTRTCDVEGRSGRIWAFEFDADQWEGPMSIESELPQDGDFGCAIAVDDSWLAIGSQAGISLYEKLDRWVFHGAIPWPSDSPCGALSISGNILASVSSEVATLFKLSSDEWQILDSSALESETVDSNPRVSATALVPGWLFVGRAWAKSYEGAVDILQFDGTGFNAQTRLESPVGDYNQFGYAVAASGERLVIGEPFINGVEVDGVVHVYELQSGEWLETGELSIPYVNLGVAVAIDSATILVGSYGAPGGAFIFQQDLGEHCAKHGDCYSGHCVDGICCESVCDTPCFSCRADNTLSSGGVDGACNAVDLGKDSHGACINSGTICGETGACDGAGGCFVADSSVLCQPAQCESAFGFASDRYCDGSGLCAERAIELCSGLCSSGGCLLDCTSNEDCNADFGFYCLDNRCVEGKQCSDDSLRATELGTNVLCSPYRCRDGQCLAQCIDDEDCIGGAYCGSNGHCLDDETCASSADCINGEVCNVPKVLGSELVHLGTCEPAQGILASTQTRCTTTVPHSGAWSVPVLIFGGLVLASCLFRRQSQRESR